MAISGKVWRSESGSTSALFAISALPLIVLAGGAVDFTKQARYSTVIQSALDTAALGAARSLADQASEGGPESVDYEVAEERARALFEQSFTPIGIRPELNISYEGTRVMAAAQWQMPTAFLPLLHIQTLPINRTSEADYEAVTSTCVYVTAAVEQGINLHASSKFTADCDVWVESSNRAAIAATASSDMAAAAICANGDTVLRATSTVLPEPTPCEHPFRDPLQDLAPPTQTQSDCDYKDLNVKGTARLRPGTYCGTTTIKPASNVLLEAGIYVFKDGELLIGSGSSASGEDILLFFEGTSSGLHVGHGAQFEGHGRAAGEFAGLIVYVDRDCKECANVVEAGGRAALEGTVYAPTAPFSVASRASAVAAPAALFIVYQMTLESSADFTVSSTFDGAVPAGYVDAALLRLIK